MAAESLYTPTNQILYNELKKRFQEVPELVIETVMIQNGYVREKCIEALGRESHRYLRKFEGDMDAMHNQFHSLQTGMNNSHPHQPHNYHYDQSNIHPGNKVHQNSGIPNNGLMYPQSMPYQDPVSAPVRSHDFEPFMNTNRGPPTSIACSTFQGPHSRTISAPNMTHSISSPGMFPSEYPYTNWHYSQQRLQSRPGNFAQSFEPSQTTTTYSPANSSPQRPYPPSSHGASYSPSHETYNPAGQVTNSPISAQQPHLPGSPVTTPPSQQQPRSLPPNIAHLPTTSAHLTSMGSPQYPALNRNWTMNGPEATGLPVSGGPGDSQYEAALLHHQRDRLHKLLQDLQQSKEALSRCKDRVSDMENKCLERRRRRRSNSFPSVEDVQKMRDENRKLRVEIGVLFTQIDGQTQLGTNPAQGQNFYSNIGKGQGGSIHGMHQQTGGNNFPGASNIQTRPMPPPRPPPPRPGQGTPSRNVSEREERTSDDESEMWNCSACTFLNHPSLDKCEVCEMPRITGIFHSHGSAVR